MLMMLPDVLNHRDDIQMVTSMVSLFCAGLKGCLPRVDHSFSTVAPVCLQPPILSQCPVGLVLIGLVTSAGWFGWLVGMAWMVWFVGLFGCEWLVGLVCHGLRSALVGLNGVGWHVWVACLVS